jgi:glutamate racemase
VATIPTPDSSLAGVHPLLPIGVFDSGVGGLTVLRALRSRLPREEFVYLGDTARLPYGTKSAESVQRYSVQAARFLVERGIKCLVIACNTASSVALEALSRELAPVPVIGVIEPGVIATEGTIRGGAYQRAIKLLRPDAVVAAKACTLFVALAEEGWCNGPLVESIAHEYLDGLFRDDPALDTLVLGCTHFPVLAGALERVVGNSVTIVDSAQTTAVALEQELTRLGLARQEDGNARPTLMATDGPERFARVGSLFLGETFDASQVELVDL